MIIAFDFDGTLWDCNNVTGPNRVLINTAVTLRQQGHKIILWTCRHPGRGLEEAVMDCAALGLTFDAVNDNLPETKAGFGDCRKILADVHVDDRSTNPMAIHSLLWAMSTRGGPTAFSAPQPLQK